MAPNGYELGTHIRLHYSEYYAQKKTNVRISTIWRGECYQTVQIHIKTKPQTKPNQTYQHKPKSKSNTPNTATE